MLKPLTLPKHKWVDVNRDFIMGLPISNEGHDGILTVIDRATKMLHFVAMKQTTSAYVIARVYWINIGKLQGSVVSDRDP